MSDFPKTPQNQVKRVPKRGHYDQATIYPIIDEAIICHVGLIQDGQPVVIPTLHARIDDSILLHGASTSRLMKYAEAGLPLCITITLVDGLVLARSVFNHSINYRSVVLFGQGHLVEGAEKLTALAQFTEKLMPGRWDEARLPTETEMKATSVVAVPINLASAKMRVGPPGDNAEDIDLPIWAGVIPFEQKVLSPQAAPDMVEDLPLPDYIARYVAKNGQVW